MDYCDGAGMALLLHLKHTQQSNARGLQIDGLRSEFEIAIDLQSKGKLQTEPLITHRFPLDDIAEAFATADEKDKTNSIKVIVNP